MKKTFIVALTLLTSLSTFATGETLSSDREVRVEVKDAFMNPNGSHTFKLPRLVIGNEALLIGVNNRWDGEPRAELADEFCALLGFTKVVDWSIDKGLEGKQNYAQTKYRESILNARVSEYSHAMAFPYLKEVTCGNLPVQATVKIN